MKKILLIIATLLACSTQLSLAQKNDNPPDTKYLTVEEQREILMQTRHEIRLGSSFLNAPRLGYMLMGGNPNYSQRWSVPTISLDYTYRALEFLEVGGLVSYDLCGYSFDDEENSTESTAHMISVVAYARYSWLNRRYVQLYSSVGFGIMIDSSTSTDTNTGVSTSMCDVLPMPEFVPIGVRFGGRLFGYFEPVGVSARGLVLSLGMGYKF